MDCIRLHAGFFFFVDDPSFYSLVLSYYFRDNFIDLLCYKYVYGWQKHSWFISLQDIFKRLKDVQAILCDARC